MSKKIIFTFCLFLMCFGLFFLLTAPVLAGNVAATCVREGSGCTTEGEAPISASTYSALECLNTTECESSVIDCACEITNVGCASDEEVYNAEAGGICITSVTPTTPAPSGGSGGSAVTLSNPLGTTSIPALLGRIIKALLGIVGSVALLMFVYGGFTWLTSGGNPEQVKKGRDIIVWATIGLAVIFIS
ncbi:MAG: hypothetical protein HQ536_00920, partial [Parcubacteria group bacterium]|nr:hypothetical protein [Parcubacteria group bacterium]